MIYTVTILLLKTPIDKPNLRSYFFDRSQKGTSQPIFFPYIKKKKEVCTSKRLQGSKPQKGGKNY